MNPSMGANTMPDLVFLALIVGFFAATVALVHAFDWLLKRGS